MKSLRRNRNHIKMQILELKGYILNQILTERELIE